MVPHLTYDLGAFILVSMYEDLQGGQVPQPLFNSQLVSVEVAINESKPWQDCEGQCHPPPMPMAGRLNGAIDGQQRA